MASCIETDWPRDRKGYGVKYHAGRNRRAHRWAWEQAHGPIPAGMLICHHCDNPPCINPEHLFAGTPSDNMHDRDVKGRAATGDRNASRLYPGLRRGEKNGHARLTEAIVVSILERHAAGVSGAALAREIGLAQSTISRIIHGELWRHIEEARKVTDG